MFRPQVGLTIDGKYTLVRLIGEGGMGSVFEARHEYLASTVALKFLNPELAQNPTLVRRFLQEARVSASIRSPHVVHVSDVDQTAEGLPYLVMELLDGEPLQALLNRTGKLVPALALDYALQILAGLEEAHNRGVVHRDLKPDNVFIVPVGNQQLIKLLDFGIAKLRVIEQVQAGLTRPGMLMGTPEYMAPEQAFSAGSVDHRADLYSVGVILFEMLAGCRPVGGSDPHAIATAILSGQMLHLKDLDPTQPIVLSQLLDRALAPNPESRFASATEMRNALLPFAAPAGQSHGAVPLNAPSERPPPTAPGSDSTQGVPRTLPPDDEPVVGRTGTVIGGGPDIPTPGIAYAATNYNVNAAVTPPYVPAPAPIGTTRKKSNAGCYLLVGLLGLGGLAVAAAGGYFFGLWDFDWGQSPQIDPPVEFDAAIPPPIDTDVPPVEPPPVPPATIPTVATTTPPPATTTNKPPPKADAGPTDAGPTDAGERREGGFPFPMPSVLPSTWLPPGFPSRLPALPFPGWKHPKK